MTKEELLSIIRKEYTHIYFWHRKHGINKYKERFGRQEIENTNSDRYHKISSNFTKPEIADIQYIEMIANEVLSGSMEWSYNETLSGNEITLSRIAKNIINAIDDFHATLEENRIESIFSHFKNIEEKGAHIIIPSFISIPLRSNQQWDKKEYFKNAERAYHDVPVQKNNIGGRIALMETNMELTGERAKDYGFFNSKALNFDFVTEEASLLNAVNLNSIVIEKIILGG